MNIISNLINKVIHFYLHISSKLIEVYNAQYYPTNIRTSLAKIKNMPKHNNHN
jgi:hypothetical protein